jgi:hypothetical protein
MLAGGDKDAQKLALQAANKGWDKPPTPVALAPSPAPTAPRPMRPPAPMGMGMGMAPAPVAPLANATVMPVFEDGDPTHRNSRND